MFRPGGVRTALVASATLVAVLGLLLGRGAAEPKVGDPAPDFTLPSTTGAPISLGEFRGKRHVLLEFYGADFSPV